MGPTKKDATADETLAMVRPKTMLVADVARSSAIGRIKTEKENPPAPASTNAPIKPASTIHQPRKTRGRERTVALDRDTRFSLYRGAELQPFTRIPEARLRRAQYEREQ